MPEVLQEITQLTGHKVLMTFVPHVIPATRGLVSTIYVKTHSTFEAIRELYRKWYPSAQAPFVRIRPGSLPELRDVVQTNYCDIGFTSDPASGYLIVASALDNLTKGAAGQAIQNLNVMYGWPETTGLL
jgi:N-acetyl-gamma-glutamyl-phosphate reductase